MPIWITMSISTALSVAVGYFLAQSMGFAALMISVPVALLLGIAAAAISDY